MASDDQHVSGARPVEAGARTVETAPAPRSATAAPAPNPPPSVDVPVDVDVTVPTQSGDQVRWGAVWAGLVVAVATFLLLEVAFFALGWLTLDPGQPDPGSSADLVTGLIGLAAFFLGGLTAAATARWKSVDTGLLHGILVWALGLVVFVLLALLGGGALLGSVGSIAAQFVSLDQVSANAPSVQVDDAVATARSTAAWAALGLGLAVAASAIGGLVGAKFWPRASSTRDSQDSTHVRHG
ncbi:hypothetical protein [uncultured Pseudokineococcus sp.]|uniref:hypothetical protein n=1 Tax=uncultured Pseudokineococcus sp. TaxID=1642928 RepID=UPI00262BAE1F|nr:hypothetical protein [uncultured Pseudokineococcus sp.]